MLKALSLSVGACCLLLASPNAAAQAYESEGMYLIENIPSTALAPLSGIVLDVSSYLSPGGREHALVCTEDGYAFVDIQDPQNPVVVDTLSSLPISTEREMRTYGDTAYLTSIQGIGIQVVDLSAIDSGTITVVTTVGLEGSDTIEIDPVSSFLYRGDTGPNRVLEIYSLANPLAPALVATYSDFVVSHAIPRTMTSGPLAGRQLLYCCASNVFTPRLLTLDVTNKQNINQLDFQGYLFGFLPKEGALSADGSAFYAIDVLDEVVGGLHTFTYVFDVSDPTDISLTQTLLGDFYSRNFNVQVVGDTYWTSHASTGVRQFDISDPANPVESGWFDTHPENDSSAIVGAVNVHAFLPSGRILAADRERGLFILGSGTAPLKLDLVPGAADSVSPSGTGSTVQILENIPGSYQVGSARLVLLTGGGSTEIPLVDLGSNLFEIPFPASACGTEWTWYLEADTTDGLTWSLPNSGEDGAFVSVVEERSPVTIIDFESANNWISGAPDDTATTGQWVLGDPVPTTGQPDLDHTSNGTTCWFTGQGLSTDQIGAHDVDAGKTTLLTEVMDLSALPGVGISYWRWFSNDQGTASTDVFQVDISNDGGQSWVPVETVGPDDAESGGQWFQHSFAVASILPPTDSTQLRFVAADLGASSLIEAAIDDFVVYYQSCEDQVGTRYCSPAVPNSTGLPGAIEAFGSLIPTDNALVLLASSLPGDQFGYFLASQTQGFVPTPPGSQGDLCLGGSILRFRDQIQQSGSEGAFSADLDLSDFPAPYGGPVLSGQTWNFQAWHRDANPQPTSNFTDATTVVYQ